MSDKLLYRICSETIPGLVKLDEEDYKEIKYKTLDSALKKSEGVKRLFDVIFKVAEEKRREIQHEK